MKKIRIYLLYLMQLFIIGVFVLVLLGDQIQVGRKNYFENEMFSENVKGVQMSSYQLSETVDFKLPALPDSRYMIYRYLSNSERAYIRGVYGTDDVFGLSAMLESGRFFCNKDYADKTMTAVIGADIIPETSERDGRRYYLYDNAEYEVIGVFSTQDTITDKAVLLNLTALDEQISQTGGIYYVDADSRNTVDYVVKQIKKDIGNSFTVTDIEFEPKISHEIGRQFTTLFVFCNISAILCLAVTTIFLITGQRYSIAVKKLCGMTKRDLFCLYGKIMLAITAAAFLLILLSMKLLTSLVPVSVFQNSSISGWHYLLTGLALLSIGFCTAYFIAHLGDKVDISSVLKGM